MLFVCVDRGLWLYSIDRSALEQLMAAAVLWPPAAALAESENEKEGPWALLGRTMRFWAVTRFPSYARDSYASSARKFLTHLPL